MTLLNINIDNPIIIALVVIIYVAGRVLERVLVIVATCIKHWLARKGRYHDVHGNSLPEHLAKFLAGEIPITDKKWMWKADKELGGSGETSRLQRQIQVFCGDTLDKDFSINRRDIVLLKIIKSLLDRIHRTGVMPPN